MTIREELERRQHTMLSPYASLDENTRGRQRDEPQCIRGIVTAFCTARRSGG